jgi:DNA-binding transcriptional ArsR family regulator
MLRLALEAADLARVRVSEDLHPAGTVMLASQALRDPAVAVRMPRLARRMAAAAQPLRALHHLVPPKGFMPDFLTPRDGVESLEAGLAAIRSAAPDRMRSEIAAAYAQVPVSAMRRRFAAADPEVLDALVAATRHYFHEVLNPYWPAMRQAYQQQIDQTSRRFARSGVDGVLRGLPAGLLWRPPYLEIHTWSTGHTWRERDVSVGGRGVVLVPSPFAGPCPRVLVRPDQPALVVYQSGASPVLESPPPADDPVDRLLGRTRAAVLRCVERPGRHTTSAVAGMVGISVSSSSEHLTTLRAAGLVSSHRAGGAVLHRISALGSDLLTRRASS